MSAAAIAPFLGTWVLDPSLSTYSSGPPPRSGVSSAPDQDGVRRDDVCVHLRRSG
ncbi:hypothetical protein [Nonomuraea sp. NPDC050643]|uniref:hypothetical protein n=1 Tax=Nonomuraea sp. NPDC050643 TaxID=3155660 RepID=UPI0033FC3631